MGAFVSYTIIVSAAMLAMTVVYRWLMSDDNQPAFNRVVLFAIYVLAFASPFIAKTLCNEPSGRHTAIMTGGMVLSAIAEAPAVEASRPVVPDIVVYVYVAGAAIMLLCSVAIWLRLWLLVRGGRRERIGRYTLVVTDTGGYTPFSWLHYIVVSEEDYRTDLKMIVAHETKHLDLWHPVDMILSQIAVIILWYTPAPYLMRDEFRSVHEYQADMAVIRSGADMRTYQLLLIRKAVGKKFPALANSLNHSKLKKRITMMMKKQSSKSRRMRALAIAPALAVALAAVNLPVVARALQSVTTAEAFAKVMQNSEPEKTPESKKVTANVNGSGFYVEVNGQSIDRSDGPIIFIVDGRQISEDELKAMDPVRIKSVYVTTAGDSTRVVITSKTPEVVAVLDSVPRKKMKVFSTESLKKDDVVVEIDGRTTTIDELDRLDPQTISSIDVEKGSPARLKIKLKRADEQSSGFAFTVVGYGASKADSSTVSCSPVKTEVTQTSGHVEKPLFPGGEVELMRFLAKNIKYPVTAINDNASPKRVTVQFIVKADGSIDNPVIIKSEGKAFDNEALRVIKMLPRFIPGKINGKPADIKYTQAITFVHKNR